MDNDSKGAVKILKLLKIAIYRSVSAVLVVLVLSLPLFAQSENAKGASLSEAELKEIYDKCFPRASDAFDLMSVEFSIDILVDPSFRAPKQISIVMRRDGTIQLTFYTLSNDSMSLGEQVDAIIERGDPKDSTDLSRKLNVVRRQVADARELKPLITEFFTQARLRPSSNITLDGVGYEIWYVDSASKVYFSHLANEQFVRGEWPIITWARSVMEKSARIIATNASR